MAIFLNFSSFSSSSGSQPLSQNLAPASSGILNFAGVFAASTRKSSESASPLKGKTETPEKGKKGSPFAKPKTPKKTSALEVQKKAILIQLVQAKKAFSKSISGRRLSNLRKDFFPCQPKAGPYRPPKRQDDFFKE